MTPVDVLTKCVRIGLANGLDSAKPTGTSILSASPKRIKICITIWPTHLRGTEQAYKVENPTATAKMIAVKVLCQTFVWADDTLGTSMQSLQVG